MARKFPSGRLASVIVVVAVLILGAYVRFVYVASLDFPLNDGGLFYVMTQDLSNNHLVLPNSTSYNALNIPFAYPPLAFYTAAISANVTHQALIDVFRVLPALFNLLTIPIFYLLARVMLRSAFQAAVASAAFALVPQSFRWLIAGGGLTRSLGLLFVLLALHQAYYLYTTHRRGFIISTGLCAGLALASHPQMGWAAVYSIAVFYVFYSRRRDGLIHSLLVGAVMLLVTSPWWGSVIVQHGVGPLLLAFQSGNLTERLSSLGLLLTGLGIAEQAMWGLLGLLGLAKLLADGALLLPAWVVAIFILDPRAPLLINPAPLAMLAAVCIDRVIMAALRKPHTLPSLGIPPNPQPLPPVKKGKGRQFESPSTSGVHEQDYVPRFWQKRKLGLPLAVGFVVLFLSSYALIDALTVSVPRLDASQREAMQWIAANTPSDSTVLVIHPGRWFDDNVSEWFPAIAQRQSILTVQGAEWLPGYDRRLALYIEVQNCKTVTCLDDQISQAGLQYTYIYVDKATGGQLAAALGTTNNYAIAYDNPAVQVFMRTS